MRSIPAGLAARLAGGTTTLAHCWRMARRDGQVIGFTDHDHDIVFGGVTYAAATGLDAAERTSDLGFAIGGGDVAGALSSASLAAGDIAAGLYDNARIEIWLVDWRDLEQRLLLDVGSIGEISRSDHAFTAELRSVMHAFDETRGGIYRASCAADLGDSRCGVDLASPAMRGEGGVTIAGGASGFRCSGLDTYASGWFTQGRLQWISGDNAGAEFDVKLHQQAHDMVDVLLWSDVPRPMQPGDAFIVSAGCDHTFGTCGARFGNAVNFRGFPHMPGNDFAIGRGASQNGVMDGGSMFR